jgi:hypothetical protein
LQGADQQLVSLDYLRKLNIPALWRGEVQVIPGAAMHCMWRHRSSSPRC